VVAEAVIITSTKPIRSCNKGAAAERPSFWTAARIAVIDLSPKILVRCDIQLPQGLGAPIPRHPAIHQKPKLRQRFCPGYSSEVRGLVARNKTVRRALQRLGISLVFPRPSQRGVEFLVGESMPFPCCRESPRLPLGRGLGFLRRKSCRAQFQLSELRCALRSHLGSNAPAEKGWRG
jgi:hypothetical protein